MKRLNSLALLLVASLVFLASTSGSLSAQEVETEAEDEIPFHHLSLFIGAGIETRSDVPEKGRLALGLDYGYRFSEALSAGALVEGLFGPETIRELTAMIPVSLHFPGGLNLVAAPGVEFGEEHPQALVRAGFNYEFLFRGDYTLAPSFYADFIEGGKITYVFGFGIGKEFR